MSVKCSRIRLGLLGAVAVLIASLVTPAVAIAQVPATAELYGVHEIVVTRPMSSWAPRNPFRDFTLNATYQHIPSGKIVNFWGFYDGNGAGGMQGDIWRIRFMPDLVGTWTVSWGFDDGFSAGTGSFTTSDTGIPGPAKLDPTNIKLLADARNNPIHWRGYGVKHAGAYLDVPITLEKAQRFANEIIDGQLVAGGHNAAYVTVPNGWPDGNCSLASMLGDQLDCPLWGDYNFYSLQAGHFFDIIVKRLHQRRVWAISWITFGIQSSGAAGDAWGRLWANHQPFMRYFVARYGAYYNFFMWSPTWEVFENADYVNRVHTMMSYLHAIDPWKRLQGAQDQAQVAWQDWQRILPRQEPSRTIFDGNNRRTGVRQGPNPFPADYPFVIIGSEDLWEFCDGRFGKPRNATEVRRGLWGALLANVLPLYDEWFDADFIGPCPLPGGGPRSGLGNGLGEGYYRGSLDWWYATVRYRDPAFTMLNHLTSATARCSGIPGHEYVLYVQGGGLITLNLAGVSGTFSATAINAVTGAQVHLGNVPGGGPLSAPSPFGADDTIVFVRRI